MAALCWLPPKHILYSQWNQLRRGGSSSHLARHFPFPQLFSSNSQSAQNNLIFRFRHITSSSQSPLVFSAVLCQLRRSCSWRWRVRVASVWLTDAQAGDHVATEYAIVADAGAVIYHAWVIAGVEIHGVFAVVTFQAGDLWWHGGVGHYWRREISL